MFFRGWAIHIFKSEPSPPPTPHPNPTHITTPQFAPRRPASVGLRLELPRLVPVPFNVCPDDRAIVVQIRADGSTWINETPEPEEKLRETIQLIFENRQKGETAFLMIDPGTPFERFANVSSRLDGAVDGLHFTLVTPGLDEKAKEISQGHFEPQPGLKWRGQAEVLDCIIQMVEPVVPLEELGGPKAIIHKPQPPRTHP